MSRVTHAVLAACSISFGSICLAGTIVKGGGDVLECRSSQSFSQFWMLDYYLTMSDATECPGDQALSYRNLLQRVHKILKNFYPDVAGNFKEYMDSVRTQNQSKSRSWQFSPIPLVNYPDEDIDRALPTECLKEGTSEPNVHQAVVRRRSDRPGVLFYEYDGKLLNKLSDLQLAYLFVHEWLRDFTDEAWSIRQATRLLLTCSTQDVSGAETERLLRSYGIDLTMPKDSFLLNATCLYFQGGNSESWATACVDYEEFEWNQHGSVKIMCDNGSGVLNIGRRCNSEYFNGGLKCVERRPGSLFFRTSWQREAYSQSNFGVNHFSIGACQSGGGTLSSIPRINFPAPVFLEPLLED